MTYLKQEVKANGTVKKGKAIIKESIKNVILNNKKVFDELAEK